MNNSDKTELKIEGMHCVSCERTIKGAIKKVPDVVDVNVNFASGEALITGKADAENLIQAVKSVGYNAFLINGKSEEQIAEGETAHYKKELALVVLSALLTLPLIIQMFFLWAGWGEVIPLWLQLVLATIVQFGLGWRFYVGSYYAFKSLTGNMDLLIGLGTTAAYLYSAAVVFLDIKDHVYFETSAAIITLILFGRLLEKRTKQKASGALKALIQLQPKQARVKKNGAWLEIPIEKMQLGEIFQIRPGEKIPIDGEVIEGDSHIDESMLTGESLAVHKNAGAKVFGGTQNGQGVLVARATAVGSQTALAGIIRLVQEAQSSRAPIQNLADKISAFFVPIVATIAFVTFILWWIFSHDFASSLINGVAVLVIACPCALGLATPTVILVSSGRGAKSGILIKNAEAIQRAEKLDVIAIDKTGTLTEGKPTLTDFMPHDKKILRIAASLEDRSEHPLGHAIVQAYPEEKAHVTDFAALSGRGVKGMIDQETFYLGSLRWMEEMGVGINRGITEPWEQEGKTIVCLSNGKEIIGYLAIADTLRAHAHEGVQRIKDLGIDVVMLTGDRKSTAQAIAHQAGITSYIAEILPQHKAEQIHHLKTDGKKVGMVGDGINDAPALAAADVGFAMRSGSDIAREASGITLMRNDLRCCADAIDLSRVTMKKIRQNLFFAFCYNVIGIPLAAAGLLNPIIAGGAMALSSISVVANSLLLNKWKAKD